MAKSPSSSTFTMNVERRSEANEAKKASGHQISLWLVLKGAIAGGD